MAAVDRKRLSIQDFSPEMQDSLRALDLDGSGSVDSRELARAAEAYRSVQARAKRLNRMLAFGAVVLMLTLAAFSGLVFAVVEMTKESRVSESGVLMVKGSNETVKTSQVLNKSTMCSQLGDEVFRDMRYLEVTSPTGATVSLNILGWARMPEDHSLHGTVVVIVTQVGTVTIDGSELAFEDSVAPFFSKAGFSVSSTGRRLQGLYKVAAFLNSIESIEDGCGHVSYNLPTIPNSFYARGTGYARCVVQGEDRCANNQMGDSVKYHNGEAFASYSTEVWGNGEASKQMTRNIYDHIDASQHHYTIDTATHRFEYQQDKVDKTLSYCSKGSYESGSVQSFLEKVEDFTYDGMTTVPFVGGEGRKFTIYAEGHPNFEIIDQFDAPTGEYQIRAMYAEGYWHVFSKIEHNKIYDIIEDFPGNCPHSASPFGVPGTRKVTGPFPVSQDMTLEAAHQNWENQEMSGEDEETLPDSVRNAAINDLGLNYESYETLSQEWPNATYVLTTPSGETAKSVEELELLYKALVDKKMNVYHRVLNEIGARETNDQGEYEVANPDADVESRRDLQGAGAISVSYDMTAIGGWMTIGSVKSKYSNAKAGVLLVSICFKKDQNDSQITKRWMLWHYKFAILIKRCAWATWLADRFRPKIFLLVGLARCAGCTLGDLNGGYFKLTVLIGWLIPLSPDGCGVKMAATLTADWGPSGMSVSVTVKFTLSHEVIENCTTSVKNWLYQLLPYVSITGGVHTARRVFEFRNMATDQYLTLKIVIYICIWAVIASTAIWVTMTMTVLTMQSGSNHTKFVQKHLRSKSIYVWACCGLTYKQAYMVNMSGNLTIKLKLIVWWFLLGDKDYDDGGWGRVGPGWTKNTRGSGCHDCSYYMKKYGTKKLIYRKKYSCKGLVKSAKWLCAANLTSGNHNKGSPPTCEHNKQGCRFYDWCDRQNWGDDDGTDNDSSGWDGDHDECNSPDGP